LTFIKLKNFSFILIIVAITCVLSISITDATENNFFSLDTEILGEKNINIKINEIEHNDQMSVVRTHVFNRGTYMASIMTSLCSYAQIAKNRQFRYFVILDEKELNSCKACEKSSETTIGFLKTNSVNGLDVFKTKITEAKEYKIYDINDLSLACGFIPIPNDEFHLSVYLGDIENVESQIKKNPEYVNELNEQEYTPLLIATAESHLILVELLVNNGADVNKKGIWDYTPLHIAAGLKFENIGIVKYLLDKNANVNAKMIDNQTPLHLAVRRGNAETANLLLKAGAKINEPDKKGNTPLDIAIEKSDENLVKILTNME